MTWSSFPLPSWARCSGVCLDAGSGRRLIRTFHNLGHNLTDAVVTQRNATLVTHGPDHWVRHPFYLAFAVAVIANTLITASLYLAITGTLTIVARTFIEERQLIDRFGHDYVNYMRRTGRFLPRIGRRST